MEPKNEQEKIFWIKILSRIISLSMNDNVSQQLKETKKWILSWLEEKSNEKLRISRDIYYRELHRCNTLFKEQFIEFFNKIKVKDEFEKISNSTNKNPYWVYYLDIKHDIINLESDFSYKFRRTIFMKNRDFIKSLNKEYYSKHDLHLKVKYCQEKNNWTLYFNKYNPDMVHYF